VSRMAKETFDQMLARVTAKRTAPSAGGPPPPPKLSPSPVKIPAGTTPTPKLK
jgi:hypothetical protein